MNADDDWCQLLVDHPALSLPKSVSGPTGKGETALHLSLSSLSDFVDPDPVDDKPTPSGRRQAVAVKDADLIVAVGSEIRIVPLGDSKAIRGTSQKPYKILHTPNIQFEIHQIALNPNGKLLAVAGAFQVAVVVLPRTGFNKLVTATVDCKSIQVGQYHHAAESSAPVAKIEWHPWGQGGSTLLAMTTDGKLREYDISVDADDPQQVLSFVPDRATYSYSDEEREVASFTLGRGRADWGPLTVYAVVKSGDVFAMCPYLPKNASVPSAYLHALECYVSAKQEYLTRSQTPFGDDASRANAGQLSQLYNHQHKYVNALLKQLPPGTAWPGTTRFVPIHPPTVIKAPRARQGPFLLQPAPRNLEGSASGDATDITYVSFNNDATEDEETEQPGLVLVAFQDGKVDVFCDVEKVEARWGFTDTQEAEVLPMLATYESIDLGIVSSLTKANETLSATPLLELTQGNHPVFQPDPIYNDTVYVYHAFGVHALNLTPVLKGLMAILRDGTDSEPDDDAEAETVPDEHADVQPVLLTFSVEQKSSTPVIGIGIPNDVYLTYSVLALTSSMRMSVFPLTLRADTYYTDRLRLPDEKPQRPMSETRIKNLKQLHAEQPLHELSLPSLSTSVLDPDRESALNSLPVPKPLPEPKPAAPPPASPEEPPAYVSLLEKDSWKIPDAIARPTGLPSNPRLSLPSGASGKEIVLTPDTLRFFGTTVARLGAQIDDTELAQRAAERRVEQQEKEFQRQREACAKMLATVRTLNTARQTKARAQLARVQETQSNLLARCDAMLQKLTTKASPALSESEVKWFEELRRMKGDVVGVGKYDDRSLNAKAKTLRREVDRLLPHMKEMKEKEDARRKSLAESREELGLSQAFELGKRSTEERTKIDHLEADILVLARKLDITLGRTPSQRIQETKNGDANGKDN